MKMVAQTSCLYENPFNEPLYRIKSSMNKVSSKKTQKRKTINLQKLFTTDFAVKQPQ